MWQPRVKSAVKDSSCYLRGICVGVLGRLRASASAQCIRSVQRREAVGGIGVIGMLSFLHRRALSREGRRAWRGAREQGHGAHSLHLTPSDAPSGGSSSMSTSVHTASRKRPSSCTSPNSEMKGF